MSTVDAAGALSDARRNDRGDAEGRRTADRLWAYSDAVFAVIVTIMVLQLKPPHSAHFSALFTRWPTVISYFVSYVFIAIIWINHHHLTRFIRNPSLGLMWTNFLHLLLVSLLPFTTAWIAQTKLAATPVMVYAGLFFCTDGAYNALERHILRRSDGISPRARRIARKRSLLALALFATATLAAIFQPWVGFALVCLALMLHIKPDVGSNQVLPRMLGEVPLQGEYAAPDPADWVREQIEVWERSGGTEGTTLRDTGLPVVIVVNRGVRSGQLRRTPLMRVEHGGSYLAVGSKGGAPQNPAWVANLRADPRVEVWDGPTRGDYAARELAGEERSSWWERAVGAYPPYARYQQRTERLIPVFLLEPLA